MKKKILKKTYKSVTQLVKGTSSPVFFHKHWAPMKLDDASKLVLAAIEIIMDLDPEPKSRMGKYLKGLVYAQCYYEKGFVRWPKGR